MRVAFVATGLMTGGAELMLYKLLRALASQRLDPLVISLGRCGRPARLIEELGIEVVGLGLGQGLGSLPRAALSGHAALRGFRPELVAGWMYHGNLAASAFTCRVRVPLVWNIRQTLNLPREKPLTRRVIRAGALLSRTPRRILYVSRFAREQHEAIGYSPQFGAVVPNGFDLEVFRRDEVHRLRLRRELGVSDTTCVVGHLARYHPMKDQVGLVAAARRVVAEEEDVLFVLAGAGLPGNGELLRAVRECRLEGKVRLLDETAAPEALLSGCDVFCLPSAWGEGFPNVLGEAMACELPSVVTRVGDGPELVGETGLVVETGDREALAQAILRLVRLGQAGRAQLGALARARVAQHFSIGSVAAGYADLFQEARSLG